MAPFYFTSLSQRSILHRIMVGINRVGFYLLVLIFSFFSFQAVRADTQDESALQIAISSAFVQSIFRMQLSDTETLSGFSMGAPITGTSRTEALVTAAFQPSSDHAIIDLIFDSTSRLLPVATKQPLPGLLPRLEVSAFLQGLNKMQTVKRVTLSPNGVGSSPSVATRAQTWLEHTGTLAQGPLSKFLNKSGIADRKADKQFWQGKTQAEQDATRQAIDQSNQKIDDQFSGATVALNRDYRNVVYEPLFLGGRIPAKLKTWSTSETLYFDLVPKSPLSALEQSHKPTLPLDTAIGVKLHQNLFNAYADQLTKNNTFYNEQDLEEFMIMNGIPAGLASYGPNDPQLKLKFCDQNAITLQLKEQVAYFRFCFRDLEFQTEQQKHAELLVGYALRVTAEGQLWAIRSQQIKTEIEMNDPSAARFQQLMATRLDRLFPKEFKLARQPIPEATGGKKVLAARLVVAKQGWLAISWALVAGGEMVSNLAPNHHRFESLGQAAAPGHRYFLYLFGAEDADGRFENTHTWATLVDYDPKAKTFVEKSISQLPVSRIIDSLRLGPERARNRDFLESFRHITKQDSLAMMADQKVSIGQWGPYEVTPAFHELFDAQRNKLKAGKTWYWVRDFKARVEKFFTRDRVQFPAALNCFHALADIVLPIDPRGFLITGGSAGFIATDMVAWHLFPWYMTQWTGPNSYWVKPVEADIEMAMNHSLHLDWYHLHFPEIKRRPLQVMENVYCNSLAECRAASAKILSTQLQ